MLASGRATRVITSTSLLKSLLSKRKCCEPFLRSPSRAGVGAHVTMEGINDESGKSHHGHDTHAIPPQAICNAYKKYQKMEDSEVDRDASIVDFKRGLSEEQREKLVVVGKVASEVIDGAQKAFRGSTDEVSEGEREEDVPDACTIYEHKDFPGLRLYPSLLPPECQVLLLDRLLHRELANPLHKTNFHDHYKIPYPPSSQSLFRLPPSSKSSIFQPLDPTSHHKPLQTSQALHKKLRWLTLGTQYDWNTRLYPRNPTTPFPADIAKLVQSLFPSITPESGVVLLYSPKDYMPVHRDVSEVSQRSLASISLGCDGLFVLALDLPDTDSQDEHRPMKTLTIRVRSGDVVQMDDETRWCWHAMPKILNGTLPACLEEWPATAANSNASSTSSNTKTSTPKEYEKWRGYMRGKRVNISCRQVWD